MKRRDGDGQTENQAAPASGFLAFLPAEYRGEYREEWTAGLSGTDPGPCGRCVGQVGALLRPDAVGIAPGLVCTPVA